MDVLTIHRDCSTTRTVACLLAYVAAHGILKTLVSDNGPQFTSHAFKKFCLQNGIRHKCTQPYHPASHGQVECVVQGLKKSLRAKASYVSCATQVQRFLFMYRNTPHSSTHVTPASLIYKKLPTCTSKFSLLRPSFAEQEKARRPDHFGPQHSFRPGDAVLALNTRNGSAPK